MQCHCSSSVPVWLDLPALHSGMMHLLQLTISPVQCALSQPGPFFLPGDVQGSQVPINRWVDNSWSHPWTDVLSTIYGLAFSRLFSGHWLLWWFRRVAGFPPLAGIIVGIIIMATLPTPAWVVTSGPFLRHRRHLCWHHHRHLCWHRCPILQLGWYHHR